MIDALAERFVVGARAGSKKRGLGPSRGAPPGRSARCIRTFTEKCRMAGVGALGIALCTCSARVSPDEPLAASHSAILGGTPEARFEAVGALVDLVDPEAAPAFCTATLVASDWVLTAAHCVDGREPETIGFSVDFEALGDGLWQTVPACYRVQSVHARLDYVYRTALPTYMVHDLALLRLAEPATEVTPIAIETERLGEELEDTSVLHVGLGAASADDEHTTGVKRSVHLPLEELGTFTFSNHFSGAGLCVGDSGGPVLLEDGDRPRLIGVTSLATAAPGTSACEGVYLHTRLDAYRPWLESLLGGDYRCSGDSAACACPEACSQDGTCNNDRCRTADCVSVYSCLSDCPEFGGACSTSCLARAAANALDALADVHACSNSHCSDRVGGDYYACMARSCSVELRVCGFSDCLLVGGDDCPERTACLPTRAGVPHCHPSGAKEDGAACTWSWGASECAAGLLCVETASGSSQCRQTCNSDRDCAGPHRCQAGTVGDGWSVGYCDLVAAGLSPEEARSPRLSGCSSGGRSTPPGSGEVFALLVAATGLLSRAAVTRNRAAKGTARLST